MVQPDKGHSIRPTKGQFHETFFAKQKNRRHTVFVLNLPIQCHQHSVSNGADDIHPICEVKFAKLMRNLPNKCSPFAQFVQLKKLLIMFVQKSLKPNVDEIETKEERSYELLGSISSTFYVQFLQPQIPKKKKSYW